MSPIRRDAARSRERILKVARGHDRASLRLNEIAAEAGVGVGTVYRHFPTPHALVEALALESLVELADTAARAERLGRPGEGLALLVSEGLRLQVSDGGLQSVLVAADDDSEEVASLKRRVLHALGSLLEASQRGGAVRDDLTPAIVMHLVCGVEHAVRLGSVDDLEPLTEVLLAGLRPRLSGTRLD